MLSARFKTKRYAVYEENLKEMLGLLEDIGWHQEVTGINRNLLSKTAEIRTWCNETFGPQLWGRPDVGLAPDDAVWMSADLMRLDPYYAFKDETMFVIFKLAWTE